MNPINSAPLSVTIQLLSANATTDSSDSVGSGVGATAAQASSGSGVWISAEGQSKLLADPHSNDDINASKLPDGIKKYLSAIRETQEKIATKMKEMQRLMRDQSLSPEQRAARINQVELEVSILNNVLFTVTHGMQELEIQLKLQLDQLKQVNSLMTRNA
jgi:Sec-independent protein translocase protein TatA